MFTILFEYNSWFNSLPNVNRCVYISKMLKFVDSIQNDFFFIDQCHHCSHTFIIDNSCINIIAQHFLAVKLELHIQLTGSPTVQ